MKLTLRDFTPQIKKGDAIVTTDSRKYVFWVKRRFILPKGFHNENPTRRGSFTPDVMIFQKKTQKLVGLIFYTNLGVGVRTWSRYLRFGVPVISTNEGTKYLYMALKLEEWYENKKLQNS